MTYAQKKHELNEEIQEAVRNGNYREKHFHKAVELVLDYYNIQYESEKEIRPQTIDNDGNLNKRKCDLYIPKTDTAIELKLKPSLRGVGQCAYYSRYCSEAILFADGDPVDFQTKPCVREAAELVPGVGFGYLIPGFHTTDPVFDIKSDDRMRFIDKCAYGGLASKEIAVVKGLRGERFVDETQYWRNEE